MCCAVHVLPLFIPVAGLCYRELGCGTSGSHVKVDHTNSYQGKQGEIGSVHEDSGSLTKRQNTTTN